MSTLVHDIRYGLRMLLKYKAVSAVAIIALALGIGANTAIFSLVNGVLLRPLPYPNPEQIVFFEANNHAQGISDSNVSVADYEDWSGQTDIFSETSAFATGGAILTSPASEPERVPRASVSSAFFRLLGVQPVLGRGFLPNEDKIGSESVAVLSHGLWKRRFGSDRNVVGQKITISGRPTTSLA